MRLGGGLPSADVAIVLLPVVFAVAIVQMPAEDAPAGQKVPVLCCRASSPLASSSTPVADAALARAGEYAADRYAVRAGAGAQLAATVQHMDPCGDGLWGAAAPQSSAGGQADPAAAARGVTRGRCQAVGHATESHCGRRGCRLAGARHGIGHASSDPVWPAAAHGERCAMRVCPTPSAASPIGRAVRPVDHLTGLTGRRMISRRLSGTTATGSVRRHRRRPWSIERCGRTGLRGMPRVCQQLAHARVDESPGRRAAGRRAAHARAEPAARVGASTAWSGAALIVGAKSGEVAGPGVTTAGRRAFA